MTRLASSDVLAMRLRYVSAVYELRHGTENPLKQLEVVETAVLFIRLCDEMIFKYRYGVYVRSARGCLTGARQRLARGVSAFSVIESNLLMELRKQYTELLRLVSHKQFSRVVEKMEHVLAGTNES